jgi:hypothetical protein
MTLLLTALLLLSSFARSGPVDAGWCQQARITGYVRTEHGTHTYDGTPIWTPEPIAAGSWNLPLGWYVDVDGLGSYRIADRGMLGSSGHVDIAVWTRAEAFALTSVRTICVRPG